MKLVKVLAAAVVMLTGLGFTAGEASAQPTVEGIVYGSQWTVAFEGNCFETVTFYTHTFVADRYGDSGTYTGGTSTLQMKWTEGGDKPDTFAGVYSRSRMGYLGRFDGRHRGSVTKGAGC
jgi:hypothetical protein